MTDLCSSMFSVPSAISQNNKVYNNNNKPAFSMFSVIISSLEW